MKAAIRHSPLVAIALIVGAVSDIAIGMIVALAIRMLFAVFAPEGAPETAKPLPVSAVLHQPDSNINSAG